MSDLDKLKEQEAKERDEYLEFLKHSKELYDAWPEYMKKRVEGFYE